MVYRACPDMDPPTDVDLDDPPMVQMAIAVESGEQDLRMLSRLAEIAMELAEAQGVYAKTRLIAAGADGASLAPHEDPTAPFNKIAQTVRRILALRAKLASDVGVTRCSLMGKRDSRRAERRQAHIDATCTAVEDGFREAMSELHPDRDSEAAERLFADMCERLEDSDEFSDYPDRPVIETIARLCKSLGIDPPNPPSHLWGATDREAIRVGDVPASEAPPAKRNEPPPTPNDPGSGHAPHPDAFSVCPSP